RYSRWNVDRPRGIGQRPDAARADDQCRAIVLHLDYATGAADADGRRGRGNAVGIAIHAADGAGDGAHRAASQPKEPAVVVLALVLIFADCEIGIGLQRNVGTVGEAQLRTALGTGAHGVAGIELRAPRQRSGLAVASGYGYAG